MRAPAREAANPAFGKYRIVPTDRLIGYESNPRTHSDAQIAKLVASITEFGFTNPILTDGKRGVVAGHGRLLAAQKLGMETVPTLELSHLSAMQRRAYVIADNRLAEDAGWDKALLKLELGELYEAGFKLQLTGFELGELKLLLGTAGGKTDPDDVPDVPADPVTVPGDVWLLGRHRLVCGDCRDILPILSGIDAVVADPPYGDPRLLSGGNGRTSTLLKNAGPAATGQRRNVLPIIGNDQPFIPAHLLGFKRAILWGANHYADKLPPQACWLAWDKREGQGSDNGADCELAWTNLPGPARLYRQLWRGMVKRGDENGVPRVHPTQKPIALMKWCIELLPENCLTILDPYVGSGTTIIAAELTGRACHAIELSPAYVDVAVKRWQAFTNQQATLESTGRTFAETEHERLHPVVKPIVRVKAARTKDAA